jgi:acid stress chaperone HdeB
VLIAGISMVTLGPVPKVQAQVTIDVAKITCDQYTSFKITDPENIAIWLSGFYNGKRDKTVVDTQGLKEEAKKVWDYCIRNPKISVMNAVETVLKPRSQ